MSPAPPFADRADAGRRLAAALPALDPKTTVVVALPRGGVPVAAEICARHGLPLDLAMVLKIGLPYRPEVALGAVVDGAHPITVVNERAADASGLDAARIEAMGRSLLPEIERRRAAYLGDRPRPDLAGRTVVVVDDGVATGSTLRASLSSLRKARPRRLILAVPVAAPEALASLARLADRSICLERQRPFRSVGAAYMRFPQVADAEVVQAMERHAVPGGGLWDAG